MAQNNYSLISAKIQPLPEQVTQQDFTLKMIKSLSVGPFRGFIKNEVFDLASRLILMYGPNGTGKSSFCEALEYSLLGNVAEAESKRFSNQEEYLKNAHIDMFSEPVLIGLDSHENEISITPNEVLFRFCFVEKNRIDNFARIAAQSPSRQNELISTLFGLDAFADFVKNFTNTMDDRYIDINGIKATVLTKKRQALAGKQEQIKTNTEELENISKEEKELANSYRKSCTLSQMIMELNGADGKIGLIQQIEEELQQPIASKNNLTIESLQTRKQSIITYIKDLNTKQEELSNVSQQVSFKQLYEAITDVQASSPSTCPACKTPLAQVVVNPYLNANEELKKLKHLGVLQDSIKELKDEILKLLTEISQVINKCCTYFTSENQLSKYQLSSTETVTIRWWDSLHHELDDKTIPWLYIEAQVKKLEEIDREIEQADLKRVEKNSQLKHYREFAESIVRLQTRKETAIKTIRIAQEAIEKFDTDNAKLIADVEVEKEIVVQNIKISAAYNNFVQILESYKNDLPNQLVADLGEMIVTLYNAFNRNDAHHEQFAAVRLPLSKNQHLEISFQNAPEVFFDALHILSEGHIRCIGLAILASKNIKENCPLFIFDDPVNAIDDDHRESIRKTLFEDPFFQDKQIILACHGEEFFKDIQNLLSAEKVSQSRIVSFLPKLDDYHIQVDHNCAPRNYILASRIHLNKNEIRDALGKSRRALEAITKGAIWPYVNKYGDGNLSIKMRSAKAPLELRNIAEQLKSKISKSDFSDPNKDAILQPLDSLLGMNGDSREWRYLNKGTHEETDRAEFDRETVNQIVTSLEQIDSVL